MLLLYSIQHTLIVIHYHLNIIKYMNMIPNEFVILPTETFISDNNYIISHITTKQFKKEEWKNNISSFSTDNSSNLEGSYYSIEDVSDFELDD